MAEADKVAEYKEAYETWQRHLSTLHQFFLEGKRTDPVRLKGALNREARAKRRYDLARLRLLGIDEDAALGEDESEDGEGP